MKSTDFINIIKEDATGGGTCAAVVGVTVETLGQKGTFSKKDVDKKLAGYTNQLSPGGIVKGVKQAKAK
ncbi:hypothetical protein UFOVP112_456 [uncultured Caudovirales phage]|uniref:Uncharacterized protein n=1 Tax=uncultured Caudovirales phage TaxID=2100421 RepID=A0A6J5L3R7_9CAUD|nr:hypothetical protein UFOVP112_456 [uncultured Caudovirales phage]